MKAGLEADLLSALDEWITAETGRRNLYLSMWARRRATGMAEREALRRLRVGASLDAAFRAGTRAFEGEARSSGPLSFTREAEELGVELSSDESVDA